MTERIILSGPEELLKIQITQLMAFYSLINNRDIGQIVGQPADDWVFKQPRPRYLVIIFKDKETPPWTHKDGRRVKEVSVTIPDAKKNLTWENIKKACSPYNWGRFCAKARLENGRQMALYGATSSEAKKKLKEIMTLSEVGYYSIDISEEDERHPALIKRSTRIYPAFATLLVRKETTTLKGRADISGKKWDEQVTRFRLWTNLQPGEFKPLT